MQQNDSELVTAILGGQVHLYADVVRRFDQKVRAIIRQRVPDREAVEDLTQVTFYKAFKRLNELTDAHKLEWWLATIARNCAIDYVRTKARRSETSFSESAGGQHWVNEGKVHHWVWDEVNMLLPMHAEVITMRYRQARSYDEIATRLGVPLSTVKGRLYEARKALKQRLQDKGLF